MRVLFVCTGNICRSAFAEACLKDKLLKAQIPWQVESAGIHAVADHNADTTTIQAASTLGIDMSAHKARQINHQIAQKADLILCMDKGHLEFIRTFFHIASDRCHLLLNYPSHAFWGPREVADPYRHPLKKHVEMCQLVSKQIDRWIAKIED
jgi:protein-tyrosine phosphatase